MHVGIVAATSVPTPSMTVDPNLVTPGPIGFALMAVLAIVVALLLWDMLRRIRRAGYRSQISEQLDEEQRVADELSSSADDSGSKP